jgi:putative NADPH-quinone reductase
MTDHKSSEKRVLVIFCHPNYAVSIFNRRLWEALKQANLTNVTLRNLSDLELPFNAKIEQEIWEAHEKVVLQFPMNWFSTPWLLKQYIDTVVNPGWFYGDEYRMQGKELGIAVTTYEAAESFKESGLVGCTIDQNFVHLKNLAQYGRMEWITPCFTVHGCSNKAVTWTDTDLLHITQDYITWIQQ